MNRPRTSNGSRSSRWVQPVPAALISFWVARVFLSDLLSVTEIHLIGLSVYAVGWAVREVVARHNRGNSERNGHV